ncbi:MAG: hypothetical protein IJY08_04975 [Clostridia bacterium]|nr:hypothetical protein [Clostridia bacterium]
MDIIAEIENTRKKVLKTVNAEFDNLLQQVYANLDNINLRYEPPRPYEETYPITASGIFKGKKPSGVIFGNQEPIAVLTWKQVVEAIMTRCVSQGSYEQALNRLCGKIGGKTRVILARSPENMRSPMQLGKNLFMETHYDTETLINIMIKKILLPIGYDYSNITVTIIEKNNL